MCITVLVCLQKNVPNETNSCNNSETGSFAIYLGDACFVNIDRTQSYRDSRTTETLLQRLKRWQGTATIKSMRYLSELGFLSSSFSDMKIKSLYLCI